MAAKYRFYCYGAKRERKFSTLHKAMEIAFRDHKSGAAYGYEVQDRDMIYDCDAMVQYWKDNGFIRDVSVAENAGAHVHEVSN